MQSEIDNYVEKRLDQMWEKNGLEYMIQNTKDAIPPLVNDGNDSSDSNAFDEVFNLYAREKEWEMLSCHPKLTLDLVTKYKHKTWDFSGDGISRNPNASIKWVQQWPDENWDWNTMIAYSQYANELIHIPAIRIYNWVRTILENPYFQISWVRDNPDYDWDWGLLSITIPNKSNGFDMIAEYPEGNWDWDYLSSKPNLPMKLVQQHLDKPWHWKTIQISNLNFGDHWICQFPDKDWDLRSITKYRNYTSNPDVFPDNMSLKSEPELPYLNVQTQEEMFEYGHREKYMSELKPKLEAVYKIENWYLECTTNPIYLKCRQKQHQAYLDLLEN